MSPVPVTRIRAGLYVATVTETGEVFEVERAHDGRGWHVYEQRHGYRGEWCQWYATKWEAVEALAP
jgi:hypothetical protein